MVGVSYDVPVVLGASMGCHHVRVARLDDYDIVLGIELLQRARVSVIPYLDSI